MREVLARLNLDLAIALGWLTRLPTRFPDAAADRKLAQALWAFPVVGAVLAAALATTFAAMVGLGANGLLAAAVAVTLSVLLTGALHEDGLADMLDGLGARGGREARLAAMRDSRIGTYGTLGLILFLLIRVAALSSLDVLDALAALLAALALGRAGMAVVMARLPLARADGAAAGAGKAADSDMRKSCAMGLLIALFASVIGGVPIIQLLLAVALAIAVVLAMTEVARRTFGGYTGDVLGATCMAVETTVLLAWSMGAG
ncbi:MULTISPECIES: adenosylcobinamide-GDP ribazoletransferase [unclassified Minwuia]|jgi:adenosylcobinamide-GDP ribazoletransferase|uniref:adenosylcobinamide-GDP ribazoletransferase n=1 Tax=unclassified Minwuia TaxID=2618799 RepID=UPI00247AE6B8|nr:MULTISPECIES: adenosylcobinamide-GDP ribazoletransferase [unclassified Minwuia]